MKAQVVMLANAARTPTDKLNIVREYLQAFVLRSLHEVEAFSCLSFLGGTALRFLYGLARFSEDLDFTLESNRDRYQPVRWFEKLKRDLHFAGFDAAITWSEKNTVHKGWVKMTGLLKELGLSGHAEQKISVKIEIDSNPPQRAMLESQVVNKHFLVAIRHHSLPCLMAGKVHALASRRYVKGRDWYDLLWYRSQRPPATPNLDFLQSSINQTESVPWSAGEWQNQLLTVLESLDWEKVIADVRPFLERQEDLALLTPEMIAQAIKKV